MLQCSFWNDGRDSVCRRCRSDPPTSHPTRDSHASGWEEPSRRITLKEDVAASTKTENELDEFGRVKAPTHLAQKTRWPPCFETHGSAFVLDARSGMFYEAVSDFFYDPQSQLYYGNQQGAYFRYDSTKRSFAAVSGTADCAAVDNNAAAAAVEESSSTKKVSISILLKTKSLSSEGTAVPTAKRPKKDKPPKENITMPDIAATVVIPKKQHAVDMEKWSERQQEIRSVELQNEAGPRNEDPKTPTVPTTAKGEPICLLCRRRFPSLDKLRHHEAASALHQENLAKQQPKVASHGTVTAKDPVGTTTLSEASAYVDRAQQRRQMHQYTEKISNNALAHIDTPSPSVQEPVDPKRNLDEANIGHQMLQKLGWKSGDGLGRSLSTEEAAKAPTTLHQDWDRIEATLAAPSTANHRKGIGR
jgi:RNA-binding protein 5/10